MVMALRRPPATPPPKRRRAEGGCSAPALPTTPPRDEAKFHKLRHDWPITPGLSKSWLGRRWATDGNIVWGCMVCRRYAPLRGQWGANKFKTFKVEPSVVTRQGFVRHAASAEHARAVNAYLGKDAATAGHAPSLNMFQDVWDELGGRSKIKSTTMSARKKTSIEWCIFQALRDKQRAELTETRTISIGMDERNERLLVRYSACKGTHVSQGILAQLRRPGRDASMLASSLRKAVTRLCTRYVPHAGMNTVHASRQLMRRSRGCILNRIEMFSADGASSEQLAGRLLHPTVERAADAAKLPSLKMIIRDKAHCARRLTQRTFKVDQMLDSIVRVMLFAKPSIATMLRTSAPCQEVFEKELKRQDRPRGAPEATPTTLGYAKQRFDSTAKPLAIVVWNLDAVISTCNIIAYDATFKESFRKLCKHFLDSLCPEWILLLGMIADASDEVLAVVRFFDVASFDIEAMSAQIVALKNTIRALFENGACLRTGFTQICLEHANEDKMIRTAGGQAKAICGFGKVTDDVIKKCLARMSAWSRLVAEVADTEFPDWELLGHFGAFRLEAAAASWKDRTSASALPAPRPMSDCVAQSLRQLARVFGVCPEQLLTEFTDHVRLAQGRKNQRPEEPATEVWKYVLDRTKDHRRNWPTNALRPILERFFVAPGSTAGIEQNFSLHKRLRGEQWHGGELTEERNLILSLEARYQRELPVDLGTAAKRVWMECFGPARREKSSHGVRASTVLRQRSQGAKTTARSWLAQRREQSAKVATERTPNVHLTDEQIETAWTEKHAKELQHQKEECRERACAAVEEGTAQASVLGPAPEAERAMARFRKVEAGRQKDLVAKRRRQEAIRRVPVPMAVRGMRVFVEEEAKTHLDTPRGAWAELRRSLQLREVTERDKATCIAVLDPTAPGDRNRTVAAMLGLSLCVPAHLQKQQGPVLQFQRAVRMRRFIFVSDTCLAKHDAMLRIMTRVTNNASDNQWRWYTNSPNNLDEFWKRAATRRTGTHKKEMVTLVTPEQRAGYAAFPRVLTLKEFISEIHVVDPDRSLRGLCKR